MKRSWDLKPVAASPLIGRMRPTNLDSSRWSWGEPRGHHATFNSGEHTLAKYLLTLSIPTEAHRHHRKQTNKQVYSIRTFELICLSLGPVFESSSE